MLVYMKARMDGSAAGGGYGDWLAGQRGTSAARRQLI